MTRRDLGTGMDGWQVLDPTPQERSGGVFSCGPSPVRAIKDRRIDLFYDIPFVYAEVNADIHSIVASEGWVVSHSEDTDRVGCLICTKAVGFPRPQNITDDYKYITSPTSTLKSTTSEDSTLQRAGLSQGVAVFLTLDKAPVAGEPLRFTVKVINTQRVAKMIKVHVNALAKDYSHSPSDTLWGAHGVVQLAPMEAKVIHQHILPAQYEDVVGDDLINLAVVLEDMTTQERVLATEEFNITSPQLTVQIADEDSIMHNKEQTAKVTFTNPYSHPVSGVLAVAGSGLIQGKVHFRMPSLPPGGRVQQTITFIPSMVGTKMLQATLSLTNTKSTVRGFKMVFVNRS